MNVLVVTSCTGMKAVEHKRQLTLTDFKKGSGHVSARMRELEDFRRTAGTMYTGQQHARLVAGIREAESRAGDLDLDLRIVSAGYGLLQESDRIAPYDATFAGMSAAKLVTWGDKLGIHDSIADLLVESRDLNVILLGDPYLRAARFDDVEEIESPTLVFCSKAWAKKLDGKHPSLKIVPLYNPDAKRFQCGLTALKGELAGRLLCLLGKVNVKPLLSGSATAILDRLYATRLQETA